MMGWSTINSRRYYRRSRRVGGRVVTEYVGGGAVGKAVATCDAAVRLRQAREMARVTELLDAVRAAASVDQALAGLFAAVARGCGFHRHHRQWRRNRGHDMSACPPDPLAALGTLGSPSSRRPPLRPILPSAVAPGDRAVFQAACRGDLKALEDVQKYLDDPSWVNRWGNPMHAAHDRLICQVGGDDPVVVVTVATAMRGLADDLGWSTGGLTERFAIIRVLHNWLAVAALEARASELSPEGRTRFQVERCLTQADRRLQAALRTLAVIKRVKAADLLARVTVVGAGLGHGGLRGSTKSNGAVVPDGFIEDEPMGGKESTSDTQVITGPGQAA